MRPAPLSPKNLAVPSQVRGDGVPHAGRISTVVLSADGKAAVTKDTLGGVRLWPALDGSAKPLVVPARGAVQLTLARRGAEYLIGYVDSADMAHVIAMTGAGKLRSVLSTPPHQPIQQVGFLGSTKLISLRKDHSFHVWTLSGTELTSYEQRSFRPSRFAIASDGKSLVAVIAETDDVKTGTQTLLLQRLAIIGGPKTTMTKLGDERKVVVSRAHPISVSANGHQVAYLVKPEKKTKFRAMVASLTDPTADPITLKDELTIIRNATIAFVNDKQVMVTGGVIARSWLIDIPTRKVFGRVGPPSHFAAMQVPNGFGADMRVAGLGSWLFVQNAVKGTHHYLGYSRFMPTSGAVSPNGKWVAWTSGGDVWLESVGGGAGRVIKLQRPRTQAAAKVRFIDDDHLLVIDGVGGLSIIEWATGKQRDTADASGPVVRLQYSAKRRVLLVTRSNNEVWLFGIDKRHRFSGPHMLDHVTQIGGLLDASTANAPILWARDLKGKYSTYTWSQLTGTGAAPSNDPAPANGPAPANEPVRQPSQPRGDMDRSALDVPRTAFRAGRAYDRFGNTYRLTTPTGGLNPSLRVVEVRDTNNKLLRNITIDIVNVFRLLPSPDAKKLLVVETTGAVTAYDQQSGKRLWGFNFMRAVSNIHWSADGAYIVAAANNGAALLAGATGKQVYRTCGSWFERRKTAPPVQFGGTQQHMCAL